MSVLLLTMGPQLGITADLPVVGVGGAGVIRFRPIGASGPVKWTLVDSTLPAEWDSALNPDGNAVTLTTSDAETAGTFSVTVRAVDSARIPVVRSFDVRVMALPLTITGAFPGWEVGVPATGELTISGGVPPYGSLAITAGALPDGVSLSIVGNQIVASGTPTVAGPWAATLMVVDSATTIAEIALSGDVEGAEDPYWSSVISLMHFDLDLTDETGRIWTSSGSVSVSPGIGKFGGGLNFPTIPAYLQTPPSADFSPLSNDGKMTIEFFVNPDLNDSSQLKYLICARSGVSVATAWVVERTPDGRIGFVFWNGAGFQQPYASSGAGNIAAPGVFTHVVIEVDVSVVRIFLNGVLASTTSITTQPDGASHTIFLGRSPVSGESSRNFRGVIDELRITKGVARYTEDFDPPTKPFPNFGPS